LQKNKNINYKAKIIDNKNKILNKILLKIRNLNLNKNKNSSNKTFLRY